MLIVCDMMAGMPGKCRIIHMSEYAYPGNRPKPGLHTIRHTSCCTQPPLV